jgi:GAF domain-containing protein
MIGKPILMLIPAQLKSEETKILKRIRSGQPFDHYETIRRRKDGRLIEISLSVSPVKDSQGRIIGASKIARDITTRRQSENQQKALYELLVRINQSQDLSDIQQAALKAIFESQRADRASLLLCDDGGVMRFHAWHNLSENYRQVAEGHSPWKRNYPLPKPVFIPDIALVKGMEAKLLAGIQHEGIQSLAFIPIIYNRTLLGKFMVYYDTPHEFTPEEILPAQTIAIQVAFAIHRIRNEQELKQARDLAQKANQAKDHFLATLSHELRTPLNPVLLTASSAAADPQLPQSTRDDFELIRRR